MDEVIKISPFSRVENSNECVAAKSNPSLTNPVRDSDLSVATKREPSRLPDSSETALSSKVKPSLLQMLERYAEKSKAMFGNGSADVEKKRNNEER